MKRSYLIIIILIAQLSWESQAQEVLWAEELIEFSSEKVDNTIYGPANRAAQILGKPNVFPQTKKSPCAWQPSGSNFGEDYVRVGFSKAIIPKTVGIVESFNPGAVARIFGYTEDKEEILLYQNTEAKPRLSGRLWNVPVDSKGKAIKGIKILVNHLISKGVKQYDAIGMTTGSTITAEINVADDIPDDLIKENLGSAVNSNAGEVAPMISADGKTLYFTRINHPENLHEESKKKEGEKVKQDVWYSKLSSNGQWAKAVNIGPPINNIEDNALVGTSVNGKTVFLLNEYGKTMLSGISKSTRRGNDWQAPEAMKIDYFKPLETYDDAVGQNVTRVEFSVSQDMSVMIIGMRAIQSYGDRDLYVCFRKADGTYTQPKNLGPSINSAAMEGAPFLSFDKKTLYFNSRGHSGYGDADIFITQRLDDSWTNWSEPKNLGPKINSPQWDGFFSIPASGDFAYISSQKGSLGGADIFRLKLFPSIQPNPLALVNFHAVDENTKKGIDVIPSFVSNVDTMDLSTVELILDPLTHTSSSYLPMGAVYTFTFSKEGFMDNVVEVDFRKLDDTEEQNIEVVMKPFVEGQKMVLENVNFDQGKFNIKESSFDELQEIIGLMRKYPKMVILLEGHTDNQGDFSLNVKLAKDRVNEVKRYLMEKGIIKGNRIQTKSWGPLKPVASNTTPELRKKNRRVEFTILKM